MHLLLLRDLLLWSNLVCSLQFSSSIASFKSALRTHLFSSEYWIHCCMACVCCCRWPVCLCNEWDIVLGSVYFCWPCCFCTLWLGLRLGVNALYLTWASITQYKNNKANKNIRNQAQYPTHYITWGKKVRSVSVSNLHSFSLTFTVGVWVRLWLRDSLFLFFPPCSDKIWNCSSKMDRGKGELDVGKSWAEFVSMADCTWPFFTDRPLSYTSYNRTWNQIQTQKFQKNAVYYDETQHAHFQVSPLFKLQKLLSGEKWAVGSRILVCIWLSCFVLFLWCPSVHGWIHVLLWEQPWSEIVLCWPCVVCGILKSME